MVPATLMENNNYKIWYSLKEFCIIKKITQFELKESIHYLLKSLIWESFQEKIIMAILL